MPQVHFWTDGPWYGPGIDGAKGRAYFVGIRNGTVALYIYATDSLAVLGSTPIIGIDPTHGRYLPQP